jgi:hypothetical protein
VRPAQRSDLLSSTSESQRRAVEDRSAERVEGCADVEPGREFAGGDSALEHRTLVLALGIEIALAEDAGHGQAIDEYNSGFLGALSKQGRQQLASSLGKLFAATAAESAFQ